MKKIGILTPFHHNYGGGEVFLKNLAEYCNRNDYKFSVIIFSSDTTVYTRDMVVIPQINSYHLFIKNFANVCKIIEKEKLDYLVLNDFFVSQFAFLFRLRFKRVYSLLHGEITYCKTKNIILRSLLIYTRALSINLFCKKIFTVNKTNLNFFYKKKIVYIGNFFSFKNKIFKKEKKYFDFIYVGRFTKVKNIFYMINIFNEFCKRYDKHAKLLMIGTGELFDEAKLYIKKLSLNSNIILKGNIEHDQLIYWYLKSRCLLLFSLSEGLPTVVLEALFCGVPCVVSRVGCNEEIIKNDVNGYCFELGLEHELIIHKMRKCLTEINANNCIATSEKYHISTFWKNFSALF